MGIWPWRLFNPACVLSCFRLCPTLCDPMDCSPPGFLSMGFSTEKQWSGLPCPPAMPSSQTRDQTHISLHLLLMQVGSWPLAPCGKALFNPAAFQIQGLSCLPANAHRVIKQQMNANIETPEKPITHILADFWFFLDVEKDCGCDKLHSLELLTFCKTISSL